MGFEQAQEAMDSALSSAGTTDQAPEHSNVSETSRESKPEIIDIGSLEKFRFRDKELTPKELEKSFMLQKDYTRKMQELARDREETLSYREEKKFHDNLSADLQALVKDPSLVSKFLEIYPQKFHQYLDLLPQNTLNQAQQQQPQAPQVDPRFLREFHDLKTKVLSREQQEKQLEFTNDVQIKQSKLDAADAKYSTQYKWADQEVVLSKLDYLNNRGTFGSPSEKGYMDRVLGTYEKLYKQDHDKNLARYDEWRKEQFKEQKRANQQGKDMGPGGQSPGQAPQKIKLKDVKNHILSGM